METESESGDNVVYENVKNNLTEDLIIEILESMLETLKTGEVSSKIAVAKEEAGNDMVQHMKIIFPLVVEAQIMTCSKFGFSPNKDGLKDFLIKVNEVLPNNQTIYGLFMEIKHIYLPPT